jgi:uncharacterized metal-binding protein YceD (DUF177 family)
MRDQLPAWIGIHHIAPGQRISGRVLLHENEAWPAADTSVSLDLDIVQVSTGRIGLSGEVRGQTQMVCQRCLESVVVEWMSKFELELVKSEAQAVRLSETTDVYVAEDGRIRLHELVREESLLALPMMPRHAEGLCKPPGDSVID